MKTKSFLLLTLFFIPICLLSQSFDREKMDQLFDLLDASDRAMLSVSIFQNGQEVYARSVAYADLQDSIQATAATVYRMGSISKTYTATMIMQMVESGKISLNTLLSDFFPAIPNSQQITIEMLLRHRSGIFNFTSDSNYVHYLHKPHSREDILQIIQSFPPVFEPDSRLEYSNSNYVLLTFILEDLSGTEFSRVLNDQITMPYSLENTYIVSEIKGNQPHAISYERKRNWEESTETHKSIPLGGGALSSTPTEMNRFFHLLFSNQIVNASSLEKMTTPLDRSGLGIFQFPFYEKISWGHTGGIDGFQAVAIYFPEDGIGVSIMSNAAATSLNDVLIGVMSIYLDRPYQMPEFQPFIFLEEEQLIQYHGTYSHPQFPLKITVWNEENMLMAQASGQPAFALDAQGDHVFTLDMAGLRLTFNPEEQSMLLQQGGMEWLLTKE